MHLMGIPELCLGLRNPEDRDLAQTHLIRTEELPSMANGLQQVQKWDPEESIVRGFKILYLIRDWVQEAADALEARPEKGKYKEDLVWRVEMSKEKNAGIYIHELSKEEKKRLWGPKNRHVTNKLDMAVFLKRDGIVDSALVQELRQLDLEMLDLDIV
jgi:hypothetical protein